MLAKSPKKNVVASLALAMSIPPQKALTWRKRLPPARYREGQVLFYRGHFAYGLLIIHEGKVELRVTEHDKHAPIHVGPNTILGLPPIVAKTPYPLTAVVVEEVVASFAGKSQLLAWLKKRDPLLPKEVRFVGR